MELHDLIASLAALARLEAPGLAQVAAATGFDVSQSVDDRLRDGTRILRDVRLPDGSLIDLMHRPDEGEWMLLFRDDGAPRIDPSARWGDDQALKISPTGKGYAIIVRAPLPTTMTASLPDDRLHTISVRHA